MPAAIPRVLVDGVPHKVCTCCRALRPVSAYDVKRGKYLQSYCRACGVAMRRRYRRQAGSVADAAADFLRLPAPAGVMLR